MKLKKHAALLLAVLIGLQCITALPASAAEGDGGTRIYHQDAPATFEEGQATWPSNTSTGVAGTFSVQGMDEPLNMVMYYNNRTAAGVGLPEGENMEITVPGVSLDTAQYGEMELTFRYVQLTNYISVDQADDFQVYVSTDGGQTWSESYADQKANNVVGFGQYNGNTSGACYDVVSQDLTGLVGEGEVINAIKIRPYGDFQGKQYYTPVVSISVTGYEDQAPASGEEVEYITMDESLLRQIVVNEAYEVAFTEWTTDTEIDTYNASGLAVYPESVTQHYKPGWLYRGPMYTRGPDSTFAMWKSVLTDEGKYVGGTSDATNVWSVIGWDCINVVASAWSQITTSKNYHAQLYLWDSKEVTLLGELASETGLSDHQQILSNYTNEQIYEAYAQLDLGDHLYGPGHSRLVTVPAHVVYKQDGSIDPDRSAVAVTEAAGTIQYCWLTPEGKIVTSEDKDVDAYQAAHPTYTYLYGSSYRVDRMFTFSQLRNTNYLPLTLKEFHEGKVEKQRIKVFTSVTADNVVDDGFIVIPQSNYHINSMTTTLTDATGAVLYTGTKYGETHDFELTTYDEELNTLLQGLAAGSYKLTVDVVSGPVTKVLGKVPTQRVFELDFTA